MHCLFVSVFLLACFALSCRADTNLQTSDYEPGQVGLNAIDPFETIEAEECHEGNCTSVATADGGDAVIQDLGAGAYLSYSEVSFGSGALGVRFRLAAGFAKGETAKINLHLVSTQQPAIGSVTVGPTGGGTAVDSAKYTDITAFLEFMPKDTHELYLTFTSDYDILDKLYINNFKFLTSLS